MNRRCWTRSLGMFAVSACLAWLLPHAINAQTVRGQVVEAETGAPLSNAFVLLLNADGERVGAGLASMSGQFILRVPGPGLYSLRIERIGFASTDTDPFELAPGEVLQERIEVPVEPIRLEGITASGEGRCNTPRETGAQTSVLWEEARKALTISAWARRDRGVPYQTLRWKRLRHPLTLAIEEQEAWRTSGFGRTAFASLSAADLATEGYVRELSEGVYDYYGVDAETLLSEDFLSTHCFTVVEPDEDDWAEKDSTADRANLIGLGFEPLPTHVPPDIAGVLWLDKTTAELQDLEFNFTRHLHPTRLPSGPFGGWVDFRHLENGVWIVDEWWLRMPQFWTSGSDGPVRIRNRSALNERELLMDAYRSGLQIWEEGGKLRFLLQPGASADGNTMVQGVVFDSTRSRPLSGATVFLTETRHAVQTDSYGRFFLPGVPEGENGIGFIHPVADRLGRDVETIPIDVPAGGSITVDLAVHGGEGCPGGVDFRTEASFAGTVFSRETGEPLEGARVLVEWDSDLSTHRGRSDARRQTAMNTEADGSFLFCGLPVGERVRVQVDHPDGKESFEVEMVTPGLNFREFLLGGG